MEMANSSTLEEQTLQMVSKLLDEEPSKFQRHSNLVTNLLNLHEKNGKSKIRDYQLEAVWKTKWCVAKDEIDRDDLRRQGLIAKTQPAIIVAPTGAGKTGMMVMLPYVLASRKVLIIASSLDTRRQIAEAFGGVAGKKSFFEKVELTQKSFISKLHEKITVIEKPDDIMNSTNLVIVNAQKFSGNAILGSAFLDEERLNAKQKKTKRNLTPIIEDTKAFFAGVCTIIVDEAHHWPAKTLSNIIEFCDSEDGSLKKLIFLTATPYKNVNNKPVFISGPDNESLYTRKVFEIESSKIEGKTIRKRVFRQAAQDYSPEALYEDLEQLFKESRTKENRYEPKAMVLVQYVDDAKELVEFLNYKGGDDYAIAAIGENKNSLEMFRDEKYKVAVTCNKGKEGYDNDSIVVCVICRKVRSPILFDQFIGRCARTKSGLDTDRNCGIVFSYRQFEQKKNWASLKFVAEEPVSDTK